MIWTFAAAFVVALLAGKLIVPWLHKLHFGQTIYDLGPEAHKKKQGTPTMGGLIFVPAAILVSLLFAGKMALNSTFLMVLASTIGFGLIGFVDDFIKVSKKRSLGLTPMQKIVPQFVLSLALAIWAYTSNSVGSALIVPFANTSWDLGIVYIPVMVFVLVGTVNSANLLDGEDGLCGGCSMIDFAFFALVCFLMAGKSEAANYAERMSGLSIFASAMAGALLGFLQYNAYPAKVFMGDVGSFFLGGAIAGIAMVTRLSLLLPIVAFAMLISSVSDIIQIGYFKLTHGKRVFRMAPLHHHFELGGMPETKVVVMYYSVTLLLCMFALLGFI